MKKYFVLPEWYGIDSADTLKRWESFYHPPAHAIPQKQRHH
jgi:hypothetical protein